jgi:tRNA-Thr(GGU) m(6)t(6)A37 methyltransferase TsaA
MNSTGTTFQVNVIGVVQSSLKNLDDCPLQGTEGAPEALLQVSAEFQAGLDGIRVGHELMLLTWLHRGDRSVLQCRRRNETTTPMVGVFTTRSPDRPNPIGLHQVKVLELTTNGVLRVAPLEALDGTPILDIKPVLN